jgi:hypothetical protein
MSLWFGGAFFLLDQVIKVWTWNLEKYGVYSVKSACKLVYSRKHNEAASHQPSSSGDGTWRAVWKLVVPPKVKVFWCRVLHQFLTTRQVLHKRHIEPNPIASCEVCGEQEESIRHVLLDCTVPKDFWAQAKYLMTWSTIYVSSDLGLGHSLWPLTAASSRYYPKEKGASEA